MKMLLILLVASLSLSISAIAQQPLTTVSVMICGTAMDVVITDGTGEPQVRRPSKNDPKDHATQVKFFTMILNEVINKGYHITTSNAYKEASCSVTTFTLSRDK